MHIRQVPIAFLKMSTVSLGVASGIAGIAASLMMLRPEPKDMTYYMCKKNPSAEILETLEPIFICAKAPTFLSHVHQNGREIIPVCPYQPEWMKQRAVRKKLRVHGVIFPHEVKFVENVKDISFDSK